VTNQQSGNQGRGSNLTGEDRRRGGETSSHEQERDDQGQYSGSTGGGMGRSGTTGGSGGMGQGGMGQGGSQGQGSQHGGQGSGSSLPRDDQGQWKSPQGGNQGGQNR